MPSKPLHERKPSHQIGREAPNPGPWYNTPDGSAPPNGNRHPHKQPVREIGGCSVSGRPDRWASNRRTPNQLSGSLRAEPILHISNQSAKECHPTRAGAGRRWIVRFLAFCCIGLIPWTIGLALTLPRTYLVKDWPIAWTGFDVVLLTCLATTAWSLWKQRQIAIPVSMITSVLLLCDAWFDILTAHRGHCLMVSIATAILAELPIAILLGLISVRLLHASWTPDRGVCPRSISRWLWTAPLITPLRTNRNQRLS